MNIYEIGDNWYQRTHRLREVWQDESKPIGYRLRAFVLFEIMLRRVLRVNGEVLKAKAYKSNGFEIGGTIIS